MTNKRSHCDSCGRDTNHEILHSTEQHETNEEGDMWWNGAHFMLKCLGCGHVSYRLESKNSEDYDDDGTPAIEILPRQKPKRPRPSWFTEIWELDTKLPLERMLNQVYSACDDEAHWLAIMGTRAIVEAVMISKVGDQGTFAKNLTEFTKRGFVTDAHRLALGAAIDQGSAAIHQAKMPTKAISIAAIQVMENVLEVLYVVPLHEAALKK